MTDYSIDSKKRKLDVHDQRSRCQGMCMDGRHCRLNVAQIGEKYCRAHKDQIDCKIALRQCAAQLEDRTICSITSAVVMRDPNAPSRPEFCAKHSLERRVLDRREPFVLIFKRPSPVRRVCKRYFRPFAMSRAEIASYLGGLIPIMPCERCHSMSSQETPWSLLFARWIETKGIATTPCKGQCTDIRIYARRPGRNV
jgi:hypothetical protein